MSDTPSTSWATWAWQAYREGRLTEAGMVQAQIDAAVKAEREWWITSLAPIRHQAASTRGEQAYRELPSFVVNVLTALFRKGTSHE